MRVIIVEDQLLVRDVFRNALSHKPDFLLAGETGLGEEAVAIILQKRPEVVLLDLRLPDISGFEVAKRVGVSDGSIRFLAISGYCDDYTVVRVERLGLHGFIDKGASMLDTLWEALTEIRGGRRFFSPAYLEVKAAQQSDPAFFTKILSDHECIILSLIGKSLSDAEISALLGISLRTAQTHRSNILHKLRVEGTPKLISYAIRHGLV
jgi:DNA-binding NarL/FixJ family response regulator